MPPKVLVQSLDAELYLWLEYILSAEGLSVELSESFHEASTHKELIAIVIDCRAPRGTTPHSYSLCKEELSSVTVPVVALVEGDDHKLHLNLIRAGVAERFHSPLAPRQLIDYLLRLRPKWDETELQRESTDKCLSHGEIHIDLARHRVICRDTELHLPPLEFKLLVLLMSKKGQVCSREQLIEAAWPPNVFVEPRTVDVHVGRLRRALLKVLAGDPIRTVRSIGYALRDEE